MSTSFPSSSPNVDQVGIVERAQRITKRSIKGEMKLKGLKLILKMIDLTTLEGMDTTGKVTQLCNKAQRLSNSLPDLPQVAAVCVYPIFVKTAKACLQDSEIKVASVATAFPSGNAPRQTKLDDVKFAVDSGADEIDMVLSLIHI